MHSEQKYHVGQAIAKLEDKLCTAQEQLRRYQASIGRGHDTRKMVRLKEEIDSLTARIERAYDLLER